jgi:hypothetical protein
MRKLLGFDSPWLRCTLANLGLKPVCCKIVTVFTIRNRRINAALEMSIVIQSSPAAESGTTKHPAGRSSEN